MPGCADTEDFSGSASAADPSSDPLISIERVSYRFKSTQAVSDISLSVAAGSIFGLVGSDGAGKSTLLRMAATMLKPDNGRITIAGLDTVSDRARIKNLIGYMPQRFGLYQDLTVEENIDFFLDIFGIHGAERKRRKSLYLGFSNLLPFTDRPAGQLSGGMKQKLGLACVLVHEPRLLILDEPTNGVDPVSREEFWEILGTMRQKGMTILISTAYLDEGERCDRIGLMHRAKLLTENAPDAIRLGYADLEEAIIARIQETDHELTRSGFGAAEASR